jgi:hypothetical protein
VTGGFRNAAVVVAVVTAGLGVALIAATLAQGGGGLGILLGVLFVAAGGGRLYLARVGRGGRR